MENFLRNTFRRNNKKKKVSFRSKDRIHKMPQHEKVDVEELWYRNKDARKIQNENQRIIAMMKSDSLIAKMEAKFGDCTRGLESLEKRGKARAHLCKRESFAVVLSTQQVQMMQGVYNPEAIARVYSRVCLEPTEHALEMAQLDERYVREHVRTEVDISKAISELSMSERTEITAVDDDESLATWTEDPGGDDFLQDLCLDSDKYAIKTAMTLARTPSFSAPAAARQRVLRG